MSVDRAEAIEVLRGLQGHDDVDVVVIGTFALALRRLLPDEEVGDVDVSVAAGSVLATAARLRAVGFVVHSWHELLDESFDAGRLAGRYYARAKRGELVVDINYALSIEHAVFRADADAVDGIVTASVEHVLLLKRRRDTPRDREVLARLARAPISRA
jgi:hypothetical protein